MVHRQPWSFSAQLKRNINAKCKLSTCATTLDKYDKRGIQKKNRTQNEAPVVALYDMRVVTFVLPNEMVDVSIAGLQRFIRIPILNHTGSQRTGDSRPKPYLHREKI